MENANARQVGGDHYKQVPLEVWDIAALYELDGFQQNILKYVLRHKHKNGVEDLEKAQHYLQKYIEIQKLLRDGKPTMLRAVLSQALEKLQEDPTNETAQGELAGAQEAATERVLSKLDEIVRRLDEAPVPDRAPGRRVKVPKAGTADLFGPGTGNQSLGNYLLTPLEASRLRRAIQLGIPPSMLAPKRTRERKQPKRPKRGR